MSGKVLIVEDEQKLSALLRDYLDQAGYQTDCIFRGDEAVARVRSYDPDLVLLDLNLPGGRMASISARMCAPFPLCRLL